MGTDDSEQWRPRVRQEWNWSVLMATIEEARALAARYYLDQPRPTAERVRVCEAKFYKIAAHLKARGYDLKAP